METLDIYAVSITKFKGILIFYNNLDIAGADVDEHVLRAAGPVLDAGAGRAAALHRHGRHEPAHHRPAPRLQAGTEEDHWYSKPKKDVWRGNDL